MKRDGQLATIILAAVSLMGQTATGIHLVGVRFGANTPLTKVDLRKCAADLRSKTYEGPEWLTSLAEQVRVFCIQEGGYYKAAVTPTAEQLPDEDATHQFTVKFDIHAGQQYRTGEISFTNNHVFSVVELRSMFKMKAGDIFRPSEIRHGLEQMHRAYAAHRYLNFTPVPNESIDESKHVISVEIYCDEGKQFQ